MNKENLLKDFYTIVSTNSEKARKIVLQLPYKNDAYLLSLIALTYKDEATFFKNGKSRMKFRLDKLKEAKQIVDKGFKVNKNCRDLLYIKGIIYNALGDTFTAIDCYIAILGLEEKTDTISNCSNSELPYIQMILNDAKFQLYRLFYDLEDFEMSNKFLADYKKHLKIGVDTIYKPLENFLMIPEHL